MGATQDIVWLQRFQELSAYEKSLEAVQSDPDYQARIKKAQSKEFFDFLSVEAGIWRQL
jgi:putative component of toxin-antitoxin plasmid stabilization module